MADEPPIGGYAKVRDGVLEHHRVMSFTEIAVFHHLLNRANRTERYGPIGLCAGLSANQIAEDMNKSRDAVQRALRGLEIQTASRPRYIERRPDGILVLNFDGGQRRQAVKRPAVKQAEGGRKTGRYRPLNGHLIEERETGDVIPPLTPPRGGRDRRGRLRRFQELDREWGARGADPEKIAACPRDHESEAVRGEPHKEGFRVEWCPDGCGWQRRVELEAKG